MDNYLFFVEGDGEAMNLSELRPISLLAFNSQQVFLHFRKIAKIGIAIHFLN